MATVYFDSDFSSRINKLTVEKSKLANKPIFPNNYSLMTFAAMVGSYYNSNCDGGKLEKKDKEIGSTLFVDHKLDGIAYLLAIDATQNGKILKSEQENEMWKYLEKYSNLGMREMESWFSMSQSIPLEDAILDRMREVALDIVDQEDKDYKDPVF